MQVMSSHEIESVSGAGAMSTETRNTIIVIALISPVAAGIVLLGYYANRD